MEVPSAIWNSVGVSKIQPMVLYRGALSAKELAAASDLEPDARKRIVRSVAFFCLYVAVGGRIRCSTN